MYQVYDPFGSGTEQRGGVFLSLLVAAHELGVQTVDHLLGRPALLRDPSLCGRKLVDHLGEALDGNSVDLGHAGCQALSLAPEAPCVGRQGFAQQTVLTGTSTLVG